MMAPRVPINSFGFGKIRISVASDGDADCFRRNFRSGIHRPTAGWTKSGLHPAPGIDMPPPDPSLAGNRHRRFRIVGAVTEGATAFPLAAEATASMDLGGLPTRRHRQISATAAGRALAGTLCLFHLSHSYVRKFLQDWQKTGVHPFGWTVEPWLIGGSAETVKWSAPIQMATTGLIRRRVAPPPRKASPPMGRRPIGR